MAAKFYIDDPYMGEKTYSDVGRLLLDLQKLKAKIYVKGTKELIPIDGCYSVWLLDNVEKQLAVGYVLPRGSMHRIHYLLRRPYSKDPAVRWAGIDY